MRVMVKIVMSGKKQKNLYGSPPSERDHSLKSITIIWYYGGDNNDSWRSSCYYYIFRDEEIDDDLRDDTEGQRFLARTMDVNWYRYRCMFKYELIVTKALREKYLENVAHVGLGKSNIVLSVLLSNRAGGWEDSFHACIRKRQKKITGTEIPDWRHNYLAIFRAIMHIPFFEAIFFVIRTPRNKIVASSLLATKLFLAT